MALCETPFCISTGNFYYVHVNLNSSGAADLRRFKNLKMVFPNVAQTVF
jgi:hypothetical protein